MAHKRRVGFGVGFSVNTFTRVRWVGEAGDSRILPHHAQRYGLLSHTEVSTLHGFLLVDMSA